MARVSRGVQAHAKHKKILKKIYNKFLYITCIYMCTYKIRSHV
jgi:ribosomal protein L20